ncbi:MAG: metallophosphoesterase [Alicyclobacillaceae bacterium]|nr:metallophosphoesterase [Alicyclobacillaceae bacterium]
MRICLVSDSHRARNELLRAVKNAQPFDAVIHAGDETSDADWLVKRVSWPLYGVSGNWDAVSARYPAERIVDDFGPRLYVTHGHRLRVKESLEWLAGRAHQVGAGIAVYGHTHIPAVDWVQGVLCVNPGSLSSPRGHRERTVAVLEFANAPSPDGWTVRVVHIDDRGHIVSNISALVKAGA